MWSLGFHSRELSSSLQATLCLGFFPKGLFVGWESRSNWGGIGASRGFQSLNDAGAAFSAGHLLPVGLGARVSARSTLGL